MAAGGARRWGHGQASGCPQLFLQNSWGTSFPGPGHPCSEAAFPGLPHPFPGCLHHLSGCPKSWGALILGGCTHLPGTHPSSRAVCVSPSGVPKSWCAPISWGALHPILGAAFTSQGAPISVGALLLGCTHHPGRTCLQGQHPSLGAVSQGVPILGLHPLPGGLRLSHGVHPSQDMHPPRRGAPTPLWWAPTSGCCWVPDRGAQRCPGPGGVTTVPMSPQLPADTASTRSCWCETGYF